MLCYNNGSENDVLTVM